MSSVEIDQCPIIAQLVADGVLTSEFVKRASLARHSKKGCTVQVLENKHFVTHEEVVTAAQRASLRQAEEVIPPGCERSCCAEQARLNNCLYIAVRQAEEVKRACRALSAVASEIAAKV